VNKLNTFALIFFLLDVTSCVRCQTSIEIVQDIFGLLLLLYSDQAAAHHWLFDREIVTHLLYILLGLSVRQPWFLTVCDAHIIMLTKDKT